MSEGGHREEGRPSHIKDIKEGIESGGAHGEEERIAQATQGKFIVEGITRGDVEIDGVVFRRRQRGSLPSIHHLA
jgi:hypothetical protein